MKARSIDLRPFANTTRRTPQIERDMDAGAYLQSLRKFLVVRGHLSVWRSSSMSPTLVTIKIDIVAPHRRQTKGGGGGGWGV